MNPLVLATGCLALAACSTAPRRPQFRDADYPGQLRAVAALGDDVLWQQHVTASWQGGQRGFDAAVQKRGDELTVLGLSPTGAMGFAIVLSPAGVDLRGELAQQLPFPPRFVLLDVQRAFYPWLAGATPRADGEHEQVVDGEVVREAWQGGRLRQRSFRRQDGEPAGSITVRYEWRQPDWSAPTHAELDNGWFGYRLSIDTHAETRLQDGG